jgi:hypothetical protein
MYLRGNEMTDFYTYATKYKKDITGFSGIRKLGREYLVPFGNFDEASSFVTVVVDGKKTKKLGGHVATLAEKGRGRLHIIDEDEFYKLKAI